MPAALLLLVALAGCTEGSFCTEKAAVTAVRVNVSALDLPADTTARMCLGEDCTVVTEVFGDDVLWGPPVPDVDRLRVSLTLTDPAGALLWSGSIDADVEVIEPNGPGCGQTAVLPELRAMPDGRLVA